MLVILGDECSVPTMTSATVWHSPSSEPHEIVAVPITPDGANDGTVLKIPLLELEIGPQVDVSDGIQGGIGIGDDSVGGPLHTTRNGVKSESVYQNGAATRMIFQEMQKDGGE